MIQKYLIYKKLYLINLWTIPILQKLQYLSFIEGSAGYDMEFPVHTMHGFVICVIADIHNILFIRQVKKCCQ